MTVDDGKVVHDFLKPLVDSGHIKAFTGNSYLKDFASGDTWAAFVWSGDLASSGGEDDQFVYPEEGSNIATDNMMIPKGAQHQYTAELMMDWVYDVTRAARLANFIYYISPVKGVAEAIKAAGRGSGHQPAPVPAARGRRQATSPAGLGRRDRGRRSTSNSRTCPAGADRSS